MKCLPRYLGLCFKLFSLAFLALNAWAHDPGLSSATVTIGDQQIEMLFGFAQKDVESMLGATGIQADIRTTEGFAAIQNQFESIIASGTSLYFGEQEVTPGQTVARRKDSQNIEVLCRFQRSNATRLHFVSTIFRKLPFGHREFLSVKTTEGTKLGEAMLSDKENTFDIDLPAAARSSAAEHRSHSFFAFVKLGVEHILSGYDHLLFLFALLVVCRDLHSMFTVISCFTIAHSLTLALAALDIVRLPAAIVEPLIAASIVYVGVENLVLGESPKRRWLVTFGFGLVHGLGFADALREFGIGSGPFEIALPLLWASILAWRLANSQLRALYFLFFGSLERTRHLSANGFRFVRHSWCWRAVVG
jgi:hydrogenase/urease accessory protein HupE